MIKTFIPVDCKSAVKRLRAVAQSSLVFKRCAALGVACLLTAASAIPQNSLPREALSVSPSPAKVASSPQRPLEKPPDKGRGLRAYRSGRLAELASNWPTAYAAYTDAAAYAPAEKEYSLLREHARFQWVQELIDRAGRKMLTGDSEGARAELLHAIELDPNYPIAQERLAEIDAESAHVEKNSELQSTHLPGLPRLSPRTGTQTFDFRGTTRTAYEEIGKRFAVTLAFDGDLMDRSIRFQTPMVDFETAVMVLERQTRTFSRVVDNHTLFVTEDSVQKVREYAPEIEKDLILPSSVTPEEMNETVRTVREMTGITRTQLNTATRTLSVRSTEQNVALAEALIGQIEQPHGEVMLEVEIMELNHDAAHQLGITPPTSGQILTLSPAQIMQLQSAQSNGTLLQAVQTIFGGAAGSIIGGSGGALPSIIAFGGGRTIFLATVPGASANFSQTLSTVRSARRVLLRAQDGKPATFFVGDRYPVSLYSQSAGTNNASTALTTGILAGLLPRTDVTVGATPVALALADLNGDGHQDVVVANQADGTISIILGRGNGTFGNRTDITVGRAPSAIAVGDFNGDGKLDIAVSSATDNNVSILLGNGDGTFAAPVVYPSGGAPVALLAKDFNADGQLDLAVVNQTDGTVSVLLGRGDGTFAAKTDYPVGSAPSAIGAADFNADGILDLAVANRTSNTVSLLLGRSNGTFAAKKDFPTGQGPAGIATADFNRDGRPDLAVTNQTDNTVDILLGNSDGTFSAGTAFATGSGPAGIVAADFTGDTVTDLIVADQSGNDMSVLVGNGDGTFTVPVAVPTGNAPVAVAATDFNGDGALDVASVNQSSNSVTVTLNVSQSANGSASQVSYPASQYEDLGLKVKITPRLHGDDEVTLQVQFDIRSLAGLSINNIPVLSNRSIEQTVRLRENQSSVLSGIISPSETRTLSGWPWTSTVPLVGYLTGERTADTRDTEMLIIITPRAMRLPPHDPRALYAGRGEPSSPAGGAPAASPQPPQQAPQPAPAQPGNPQPGPAVAPPPPPLLPRNPAQN